MPNLGASLGIGLTGLQASQEAINVVGHNIANVNTPGYSRQSAVMSSNQSANYGNILYGTGVNVDAVKSLRDQFLNLQVTQSLSNQSGAETRYSGVQAISSAFADDGTTGINSQIHQFFTSLSTMAATPEDRSVRQSVVGTAQSMLNELKGSYQTIAAGVSSCDQQVAALVPQVNTLTAQIAKLNASISQQVNPSSDNDAIDQRQTLTDQLSKLVGIQVSSDSKGQYLITLDSGAATLVSGQNNYQMTTQSDSANGNNLDVYVSSSTAPVTGRIKGGQLGGNLDLRDKILPGYLTSLDQLGGSLAGQLNRLNMSGSGLPDTSTHPPTTGATGTLLFTGGIDPTTGQASVDPATGRPAYKGIVNALEINAAVLKDPGLIAAARTPTPPAVSSAGDNSNALKMAALQTKLGTVDSTGNGVLAADGSFVGGTGPISTAVSGLVNAVATQAQEYNTTATNQENLTTALQTQQNSASGVDLDQEAAQLLAYQQGYQASAQFISTITQLTNQLMTAMSSAG